jgi:cytosine/adenosine deaminase-related metal-dependent hydrolase/ubiquinone/menaquinone biosynthesis C-methylase UbiE
LGAPIHQSAEAKSGKPLAGKHVKEPHALASGGPLSAREAYRQVSRAYDTEPNPLLLLEQRFLERLLPPLAGLDVLDLGCGTGRWLAALAQKAPGTLVGADLSPEMLTQAQRKTSHAAQLVLADCDNLPFPRASADLILCSFLVSYLKDLAIFAEQVRRVIRRGGVVFVTDLHPETAAKLAWRRGFHVDGSFVDLTTCCRPIQQVTAAFDNFELECEALLEPQFGDPELELFKRAGRTEAFHAASGHPAIYILQLSLKSHRRFDTKKTVAARALTSVTGARITLGAKESVCTDVTIEAGRIAALRSSKEFAPAADRAAETRRSLDLSGFLLLPGLVNAHDHLEFALFPRIGKGGYRNFVEWADDIHRPGGSPIREHRSVPKSTRLWWGGIRNLVCGVTTVCHHNPYVAEVFASGFAVRVLRDYGWGHSLAMDHDLLAKQKHARPDQPFILHLGEGMDSKSAAEIFHLAREKALDDRTVIVHGLALDDRGKALLRSAGAALVWCPSSNVFLFGHTHDRDAIRGLSNTSLGSDSPLTAEGDLLDEIRFAHEKVQMPEEDLYALVTTRAARVLRLKDGEGTLRAGALADFVGVRDTGLSPAKTLASMSYRDVELVVIGGSVQLASGAVVARLPRLAATGLRPLEIEGEVRWIRAPIDRLFAETKRHLPGEIRLGGKKVSYVPPA